MNLERALQNRNAEYLRARSAAYCRISTEFAAYQDVEMERAKSDLEEHRALCVSVVPEEGADPLCCESSSRRS
jgi:hypothetical protein